MTPAPLAAARVRADELDRAVDVAFRRDRFLLPAGTVYLDGNSLGPLPAAVPPVVADVVTRQWGQGLVASWNAEDWWHAPERVGARIAPLVGAATDEVVVADSTSVNLFAMLVAATRLRPGRRTLLVEQAAFPTDGYIAASVARLLGLHLRPVDLDCLTAAVQGSAGRDVAAVLASQVDYRTGRAYDVAQVTRLAHDAGALAVWDLSHSAGAMPVDVDAHGVDLAVGCGYKYLGGGPGAPSYVVVARAHQGALDPPLTGWHGHARPFAMAPAYEPALGVSRVRVGTPPILSLLALEAALTVFDGLDIRAVRSRSLSLTSLFCDLADEHLAGAGFTMLTPRAPDGRGSQVALRHPAAYGVVRALGERGVVADFREPDIVRLGFGPLYLTHADVVTAVEQLAAVAAHREFDDPRWTVRATVT